MRKLCLRITILAILLCLCGCSRVSENETGSSDQTEEMFIETDLVWKDNSLDAYSAAKETIVISETKDEKALNGGATMAAMSKEGVAVLKKHLYEKADDSWDEITYLNRSGELNRVRIAEGTQKQAWGIGSVADSNHYVLFMTEKNKEVSEELHYLLVELDENLKEIRNIEIAYLSKEQYEFPLSIMVDANGYCHMITENYDTGEVCYYISDSDGKLMQKMQQSQKEGIYLQLLPDGSVALHTEKGVNAYSPVSGEATRFSDLEVENSYCMDWNQKEILLLTRQGIYRKERLTEHKEPLYVWLNHGISVSGIAAARIDDSKGISVLFTGEQGYQYVHLVPTENEVTVVKIPFAVSRSGKEMYAEAVTQFNKAYPAYHITLEEYQYADSKLLTKITTGEGPVLIDADLLEWETQTKYLEPLSGVFEQIGLSEVMVPEVIELGKSKEEIYAVPTNFYIRTVVSGKVPACDWNYEQFLSAIQKEESLEAIFNSPSLDYGNVFVTKLFMHGVDDSFLWDSDSKEVYFDSEAFRTILRLGKEYENKNCAYEQLMDGTMLCMAIEIMRPQQIAFTRVLMGDHANYVGYPTSDGAKHYLSTGSPIAVSAAATEEERKIAHTFINMVLSYDTQAAMAKSRSFCMSVREDVLDEQVDAINTHDDVPILHFPQIQLEEDQIDNEADRKTLRELMEGAIPEKKMPRELQRLMIEELEGYFTDAIDENTIINNLTNRVSLYLAE